MYEEIDRSGQSKWNVPTILVIIVIFALIILRLQEDIIGANLFERPDLQILFALGPMCVYLLGTLFGGLRKRSVTINPDLLEFEAQTRHYKDFGTIYYEGDFKTGELSGSPPHICGWILFLFVTPVIGWIPLFMVPVVIDSYILPVILFLLVGLSYPIGIRLGYLSTPISSNLVKDPLTTKITKYLTTYNVLFSVEECEIVDKVMIKYRYGTGQYLSAIDNVRVVISLTSEPQLEIEMTLEDVVNIGPEYTFYHDSSMGDDGEIAETLGSHTILVTRGMEDSKYIIRVRYQMNRFRARWALGTESEICQIIGALQERIQPYVPHTLMPKEIEDTREPDSTDSIEDAFDFD